MTLFVNVAMFLLEGAYGFIAHSTALLADSLDMLGDAVVYAVSLYAIGRSARWNASISLLKGSIMLLFGLGVIGQAIIRFFGSGIPEPQTMGLIALIALGANLLCAILLLRHRNDDLNMRSTWLCSRNDVIANAGVIGAAALVALLDSKYPDLIVGFVIATLVLCSAWRVLKESMAALSKNLKPHPPRSSY